jgi:hypothetical protein
MVFEMNQLILHIFLSRVPMNAGQPNPKTPFVHTYIRP